MLHLNLNRFLQKAVLNNKNCLNILISGTNLSTLASCMKGSSKLADINKTQRTYLSSSTSDKDWQKFLQDEKNYGKLVYKSPMIRQLFNSKLLSLSSSVIGVIMLPFLTEALSEASLLANISVFGTACFFIFLTPTLFQIVARRHVNRLYYDKQTDTYTTFLYNFFLIEYHIKFQTKDIQVPAVPGPLTSFKVPHLKRKLFVDYNRFSDQEVVEKMLGYDKPIDYYKYDKKDKKNEHDDDD